MGEENHVKSDNKKKSSGWITMRRAEPWKSIFRDQVHDDEVHHLSVISTGTACMLLILICSQSRQRIYKDKNFQVILVPYPNVMAYTNLPAHPGFGSCKTNIHLQAATTACANAGAA